MNQAVECPQCITENISGIQVTAHGCQIPRVMYTVGTILSNVRALTGLSAVGNLKIEVYSQRPADKDADYHYAINTIHIWGKKCSRDVLQHELTHALLGNFIGKCLPRECTEIIPMWVDEELF